MKRKTSVMYYVFILMALLLPSQGVSQEPDCNCDATVARQPAWGPVRGMADTHAHQFSNMAFGGALLWGKPFDERGRGIRAALSGCDYTWDFALWRGDRLTLPTRHGYPIHKSLTGRLISLIMGEGWEHSEHGWRSFDHWPRWDTTMHQRSTSACGKKLMGDTEDNAIVAIKTQFEQNEALVYSSCIAHRRINSGVCHL